MMDRRALPGLIAGLAGLAFGVGAVVLELPVLTALAATCSLVAGATSVRFVQRLQEAERHAAGSAALASLVDLPAQTREGGRSLIDAESGLPDARFFELAVTGRVAAARRHLWPVTLVLMELGLPPDSSGRHRAQVLSAFAGVVRRTLREADILCRIGEKGFGLVLENTSEEGGVWAIDRVQVALAQDVSKAMGLAAGVATYPVHGLEAEGVMARAQAALSRACAAGSGRELSRVEVAKQDLA